MLRRVEGEVVGGRGEGEVVGERGEGEVVGGRGPRGEGEVVTTPLISLLTVGKITVDKVGCVEHCMNILQDRFLL